MLRLIFAVLLCATARAQFRELATDGAGTRVWFVSELPLKGAPDSGLDKIYSAEASGAVILVAARDASAGYAQLRHPQVSSDGQVLAFVAELYCHAGTTCRNPEASRSVVARFGGTEEYTGEVEMSRNGRYLLRRGYSYFGPTQQLEIIDRMTAERRQFAVSHEQRLFGQWHVSDDGAAVVYSNGLWLLRSDGAFDSIASANFGPDSGNPFFSYAMTLTTDAQARLVIYSTTTETPALAATVPGNPAVVRDLVTAEGGATAPVLSADGQRLLYLAGRVRQVWIRDMASGAIRQITHDPAGMAEVTLSGDGHVAWTATLGGRLLRIDVDAGETREIVPQTTAIETDPYGFGLTLARGGLGRLRGRGLATGYSTDGVEVLIDGRAVPVISATPYEIVFQTPWELTSASQVEVRADESPFEQRRAQRIRLFDSAPEFLGIAHADFRGPVTNEDAARPDEVIHLYLTGLGPVSPAVTTGQPAPASPLSPITGKLFVFWGGELPANLPQPEVLFAGLAPGLTGVYQVDIRVPHIAPATLGVSLQTEQGGGAFTQFRVSAF